MKYPHLFQPVRLGALTLKNRLAMSQMTMNYATKEGFCTPRLIDHYVERASGGVGLSLSKEPSSPLKGGDTSTSWA